MMRWPIAIVDTGHPCFNLTKQCLDAVDIPLHLLPHTSVLVIELVDPRAHRRLLALERVNQDTESAPGLPFALLHVALEGIQRCLVLLNEHVPLEFTVLTPLLLLPPDFLCLGPVSLCTLPGVFPGPASVLPALSSCHHAGQFFLAEQALPHQLVKSLRLFRERSNELVTLSLALLVLCHPQGLSSGGRFLLRLDCADEQSNGLIAALGRRVVEGGLKAR
mmetsp:Transcript_19675/g.46011  ORF Transcript_19675/g.46011 Transcript_19675/m.46011 type:complete len:220 (-) Transcript_19675:775-1434(-)